MRGFDGHKRVKGRKRHIVVDTLGLLIASRVEPAGMLDGGPGQGWWPASRLYGPPSAPSSPTGHESPKLAAEIKRNEGWRLPIVKRSEPAFKIVGLNWIVERTIGWLGRHRCLSKDYEFKVRTSETLIEVAAIWTILNRLAPA